MVLAAAHKPQPTMHDKKRQGAHHKTSKHHYSKTYWPYLPMLLIVGVGFLINTSWGAGKAVLGYATNVSQYGLLQETNTQRRQNDKDALTLNAKLSQAAQTKAQDMAKRNYWSHVSPDGTEPWQFLNNAGYVYMAAGENLAYGFDDSNAAVAGWMNSPGHRANILNTEYREVGFGMANVAEYQGKGEQTIIVALYGQPQKAISANSVQNGTAPVTAVVPDQTQTAPPVQQTDSTLPDQQVLHAKEVARVDVLTSGNAQWAALAVAIIGGVAAIMFVYRHGKMWRKLFVQGEQFIIHHPFMDITLVALGVLGFLLTRTSGFIH